MDNIKLSSIITNFIFPLKADTKLQYAFDVMLEKSVSSVVVTDDDSKPIGILTEHDALQILTKGLSKETILCDVMSKNLYCVKDDMNIHDAYLAMEKSGFRHLVVVKKTDTYLGVVTEGDFLRHMDFEEIAKLKSIEDVMNNSLLTVEKESSLDLTINMMSNSKNNYAIILDNCVPVGIVTERDIAHFCAKNPLTKDITISAIEQSLLLLVKKTTTLKDASNLMKKHGIHQLVVINDNGNLAGLITRHDILKAIHGSYFDFLLQTIDSKTQNEKQLLKHKQELEQLLNYDHLTKLPNRLLVKTHLTNLLSEITNYDNGIALIIFDLDRFKDINDSYGHTIGDELLKVVAQRLVSKVNENDIVARLGGDEFALILKTFSSEQEITKKIRDIIFTISLTHKFSNGVDVQISTSAGIVIAKQGCSAEEALQHADNALYQSKQEGRGMLKYYTQEMTDMARSRLELENNLRIAIKNSEFEVYYQPQVHIQTGNIIGAEALVRWNSPTQGLISPDNFIPVAEDTGLINEIGEWVLNETCRQGKIWMDAGHRLTLAVNVSANQVKYQNLPVLITKALQSSGFRADKLEIELTESALMQREDDAVKMLHELRAKGIRLAIDDFGTGYSSLAYLKKFPIDVLKIDKSFIDDIPYEKDDMAIVVAIIEMGKALGYEVLAEGTEHIEQINFLKDKGCAMYQGYYKSKPLPAKEFEKLLQK